MNNRCGNTAGWIIWIAVAVILILMALAVGSGCEPITIQSPGQPQQQQPADRPYTDPPRPDRKPCPDGKCPPYATGPINLLEKALRHPNYSGGSCAHAGMQDALIAQGMEWTAKFWRHNYSGAAGASDLRRICEELDLRYACTTKGEVHFLEWCSRTRRPACIFYFTGHAITFVGFDRGLAVLIDNNHTTREIAVPKDEFLRKWNAYGRSYGHRGGVAFTFVYAPNPPAPAAMMTAHQFPFTVGGVP